MRVARPVVLSDDQKRQLRAVANSKTASVRFAQRAKMILLAGDGLQDKQIAAEVEVRRQAVSLWRGRFLALGINGIARDAPRGGRHRTARVPDKVRAVIERTTQTTPPDATHWSTNSMAKAEGISASTVARIWREHGLKPHRVKSFKLSNDKRFVEKLDDGSNVHYLDIGKAFQDGTHHNNYGSYELAKCVIEGIRQSKLDLAKFIVDDEPVFDPSKPDPVSTFVMPASVAVGTTKPEGN